MRLSVSVRLVAMLAVVCGGLATLRANEKISRPNVLFISLDDLNDWIGCMGGHPQAKTPNLDRLAASGILFNNAHCVAPACNPSRSAIFTGRAPNRSGMYDNRQQMREVLKTEVLLPQYFRNHGYNAFGSGKLLHYFIEAKSWDEYFPEATSENPLPRTHYPKDRPVNLPRGGPWQYVETDWAALDVSLEEFGGDYSVSEWISGQLSREHEKPFFLACGFYRPHEPWFVPKEYFEPFPLDSVQLPQGYKADDLGDVPEEGVKAAKNRYFKHIQENGQWKQGVQAYLASIYFADAMLGRVLDSLENGPNARNTIVVLWSDHGWQLGEKEHWQKYTGWRAVTRVPLIVRVPEGCSSSIDGGTEEGVVCSQPVNLLSLFPTLLELCDLPASSQCDGPSILPLLKDATADWMNRSVTYLAKPGSYSVSGKKYHYIHYSNGGEELYDVKNDPYEWENLVGDSSVENVLNDFRRNSPSEFAERVAPSIESLTKLKWVAVTSEHSAPASKPDGNPFPVYFINESDKAVELCWMNRSGEPKSYGQIGAGETKQQRTRPGAVWLIRQVDSLEEVGHFTIGDRTAQARVPAQE